MPYCRLWGPICKTRRSPWRWCFWKTRSPGLDLPSLSLGRTRSIHEFFDFIRSIHAWPFTYALQVEIFDHWLDYHQEILASRLAVEDGEAHEWPVCATVSPPLPNPLFLRQADNVEWHVIIVPRLRLSAFRCRGQRLQSKTRPIKRCTLYGSHAPVQSANSAALRGQTIGLPQECI